MACLPLCHSFCVDQVWMWNFVRLHFCFGSRVYKCFVVTGNLSVSALSCNPLHGPHYSEKIPRVSDQWQVRVLTSDMSSGGAVKAQSPNWMSCKRKGPVELDGKVDSEVSNASPIAKWAMQTHWFAFMFHEGLLCLTWKQRDNLIPSPSASHTMQMKSSLFRNSFELVCRCGRDPVYLRKHLWSNCVVGVRAR